MKSEIDSIPATSGRLAGRPAARRIRRAMVSALCVWVLGPAGPLLAAEEAVQAVANPVANDKPAKPPRKERPVLTPDLAGKLTQNPLSNIFSMPMVNDLTFNFNDTGKVANAFELRPILSFPVRRWRILTRWTMPFLRMPDITSPSGTVHGFGDLDMTTWAVPPQKGSWTFGFGLAKGFKTATSIQLTRGGWSMGPAALAVFEQGPWVASMEVSYEAAWNPVHAQFFSLEYLVAYNLGRGWALVSNPDFEGVFNLSADRNGWLVPIGGGIQKNWAYKRLGLSLAVEGYYNAVRPTLGGKATLRTALTVFIQGVQPRDWLSRKAMKAEKALGIK